MLKRVAIVILAVTSLAAAELPLVFERNNGQAGDDVRFVSRAGSQSVALLDGGGFRIDGVEVSLSGASSDVAVTGADPLPGRSNYFVGSDPKLWHTNIEQFAQVRYRNVYPGIDLAFHQREYDFIVAPHSDPSRIRLEFRGGDQPHLDNGDLVVPPFRQRRPRAYQTIEGQRREVTTEFVLSGNSARFRLGPYDHRAPLVIDPVIVFATYLGGSFRDIGSSIAVDGAGNIYVAGSTQSTDFPASARIEAFSPGGSGGSGSSFAFVTKLSPDGSTILYSTVMGDGSSSATGIMVDANGDAYVTGLAGGTFPTTAGAFQSSLAAGFIAKLNPAGNQLLFSALIAGQPNAIALDSSGAAYVTGAAYSDFIATTGAFQTVTAPGNCPQLNQHEPAPPCSNAFVLKLRPDGSALVYATFLGGVGPDSGNSIVVDPAGNAVVTGSTASNNFPVTSNAAQSKFGGAPQPVGPYVYGDAFVTKLNAAGSALVFSTYLGGSGNDYGSALAIDLAGNIYMGGGTDSSDFPATNSLGPGSFVTKLTSSGGMVYSTLVYSAPAIAVDQAGYVYMYSSGPPPAVLYTSPNLEILNPAGNALVSSGGSGVGLSGSSRMVLDGKGFAYQTGQTGVRIFFGTPGAVQPNYSGGDYTAFVVKVALSNTPQMWVASAVNAATQRPGLTNTVELGDVAPGEIVSIYGALLGPDTGIAAPAGSAVPTLLGGAKVLFDGTLAPLLWVQSNQINAVVPFEIQWPSTAMTVEYNGNTYGPLKLPVATTVPGIFSLNGSGGGQAAVINQDGTPNSSSNPAAKGSIVSIYATGAGLMNSSMTDGSITPSIPPFPIPQLSVQVAIGGLPATVQYAGAAPGLVAGAIQVNAYIPAGARSGSAIPVVLDVGGYISQPSNATAIVTIAIQ